MSGEFDPDTLIYLEKIKNSTTDYLVGIDVGASNTRIALSLRSSNDVFQIAKFKASDAKTLIREVDKVGQKVVAIVKRSPKCGVAAVAGPPSSNGLEVEITNYMADSKVFRVSDFGKEFFPHETSFFINDLEGSCYGIDALGVEGSLRNYFELAWEPTIPKIVGAPVRETCLHHGRNMVLAAGTGLGAGLLLPEGRGSEVHTVLPLEAGHIAVNVTTLDDKEGIEERELLTYLSKKLYDGKHPIEYEDLVSGRGVIYAYGFFALKLKLPPADSISVVIAALKEANSPSAEAALSAFKSFFRFLIRCAQTMTVATQSHCVFLAGDNQVDDVELFRSFRDVLKAEWEWHTKPQWVQPVFVWTQFQKYNFNLKGALFVASKVK